MNNYQIFKYKGITAFITASEIDNKYIADLYYMKSNKTTTITISILKNKMLTIANVISISISEFKMCVDKLLYNKTYIYDKDTNNIILNIFKNYKRKVNE